MSGEASIIPLSRKSLVGYAIALVVFGGLAYYFSAERVFKFGAYFIVTGGPYVVQVVHGTALVQGNAPVFPLTVTGSHTTRISAGSVEANRLLTEFDIKLNETLR